MDERNTRGGMLQNTNDSMDSVKNTGCKKMARWKIKENRELRK